MSLIYFTASLKEILWNIFYSDTLCSEPPWAVGNLTDIHKTIFSQQMEHLKNIFFSLSKLQQAMFVIRAYVFTTGHPEDIDILLCPQIKLIKNISIK